MFSANQRNSHHAVVVGVPVVETPAVSELHSLTHPRGPHLPVVRTHGSVGMGIGVHNPVIESRLPSLDREGGSTRRPYPRPLRLGRDDQ